ncbi:MAG: ribosome biogenesis GTPase Der [bacterium]|nr:ribosome biogenesis GTPase Der [bacterium]
MEWKQNSLPKVVIVGRPNVGKSTLFNRIIPKRIALVDKTPGVTRDRLEARAQWGKYSFILVDTGGLEPSSKDKMFILIKKQVDLAVSEASVILALFDNKEGVIPPDKEIAEILRKTKKPVLAVVNKVDNINEVDFWEFYKLGLGKPIPVSSLHGLNIDYMLDEVVRFLQEGTQGFEEIIPLKVAIVGRPNVGKSSLLNSILGEERVIVSEEPGTTHDSINTIFSIGEHRFLFIDTAGIRQKTKIYKELEGYCVSRAKRSISISDVAILVIDLSDGLTNQDRRILRLIETKGKGGVICGNKLDLIDRGKIAYYQEYIRTQSSYLPVILVSSKTGKGVMNLINLVEEVGVAQSARVETPLLNKAIEEIYSLHQPRSQFGKSLHIYYATQVATSPPTFLLFVNYPHLLTAIYRRYLENQLRNRLKLHGTSIRIIARKRR